MKNRTWEFAHTRKLRPLILGLALLIAAAVIAPAARAQDVKCEKYTLPNGLTVILHEDHSLPIATINLWYYVGAKEEPPRRSGFAHLFEHLMFMGTNRVPGSGFDDIMEAGGGSNNASTSLDRTNYFSSGPAELLPTLLYLDADRMEDLGRFMTKEKLDLQRDVVRNEIRQNVENTPYGRADDSAERIMFPVSHPYQKGVYGTHEDLEAATVNDVRDFFANFYIPNNCSLVVAGDFDPAKIKPLVEKLFASIPAGPKPNLRDRKDYPMPELGHVARTTMFDNVEQPRITFMYHSPAHFAEGDADMDLIASILAGGKSSRLYQRLVLNDQTAVDVAAYQGSQALSSIFYIQVYAVPGVDLNKLEKSVDEEIEKLRAAGPTSEELAQYQAQTELAFLSRLNSLSAKADQLNQYQYAFGEPNSFKRDLDRYRGATTGSIKQWAKKVLTPDSRGIVWVLPMSAEGREATARDTRPSPEPTPEFMLAKPEQFTLSNGVPVQLIKRTDLPLVAMRLSFHPASRQASGAIVPGSKAGLPSLLAEMLEEGAGDLDSVGFARAMESAGAQFGASADQESFRVSLTGIRRNLDKAVGLMADAVRRPKLAQSDFDRVKRLRLEDLAQSVTNPQLVSGRVASRVFYGESNPYAYSDDGTPTTIEPVKLDDVKGLHDALLTPANASIFIAGDLTQEDAKKLLEKHFADWKAPANAPAITPVPIAAPPSVDGPRIVVVNRPDAVQTVVRFVMPGVSAKDPSRNTLRTLNTILGGSFTSRLNRNLREEHGYTYGAGSRFFMEPTTGCFMAYSAVKADVTGPALLEFYKELDRVRSGDISLEEVGKGARSLRTDLIDSLSGLGAVVGQAAYYDSLGLPFSTLAADLDDIAKVSKDDLNRIAPRGVPLDKSILVLVGDRNVIDSALSEVAKSGRTLPKVEEVDAWGEPVQTSRAMSKSE